MNERDLVSPAMSQLYHLILPQITRGIHTDCLLNYETVKYFGGEEHEGERYRSAIRDYQSLEYSVISMSNNTPNFPPAYSA
jgi:ATP-binding cassette subfamily B (MDR/TAP) protein 6